MEEVSLQIAQCVKSLLLRAWRERWPEEKWSISMKQFMPYIVRGDDSQLSGLL